MVVAESVVFPVSNTSLKQDDEKPLSANSSIISNAPTPNETSRNQDIDNASTINQIVIPTITQLSINPEK